MLLAVACGSNADPDLMAGGDELSTGGVAVVGPDGGEGTETIGTALSVELSGELSVGSGDPAAASGMQPTTTTIDGGDLRASAPSGVPLVIFDTDMGPDIDDALALAMLHAYQNKGMIELAAVTISRDSPAGARYTDAVNTVYGRPDIPIAINRKDAPYFDDRLTYVSLADTWPNDVAEQPIAEGFELQRRVLARGLDSGRPVILIQTGFSGNVSQLLDSPPDSISPLGGVDLVRETASELSVMAGSLELGIVEFNIEKEIGPARNVFQRWPGPLVMSPFELGNAIHYPYAAIRSELNWVPDHPVKVAYVFRDLEWHVDAPPFYDMRSWDLTSVIQAVEPEAGYFEISGSGTVVVDATGRTTFNAGPGRHQVLPGGGQYSAPQRSRVIDRMIELVSIRP